MRLTRAAKPKRSLLAALLRRLGPPPGAPRRHFSKQWGGDERDRPVANRW
ncbi:MAG: hypothetical protein ACRDOI_05835 [Trebonia sp.]